MLLYTPSLPSIEVSALADELGSLEQMILIPFAAFETRVLVRDPYSIRGFWEVRAFPCM
jgi:hypothetical protein